MTLEITVAWSLGPRQLHQTRLSLPAGSTLRQALQLARPDALINHPTAPLEVGIWGRKAPLDTPLRDGDRVECYRPLQVDPKVARKARFGQQGARTAGLFARRRAGGKPGY
jgi:uncharacterized protein